ncbi:hypothetical protein FHS72_002685 [Loktanella ponticola]|uniref:Uncharacterized protein n=1 Tax=Yoonia ponticola TaxID=1524255 RepID=A0A7W9BM48_9RHOB|nr:hypothetical protein [Yoonia ponticola]MBB5723049.1 hypothetical protein [Yoonia ponticola]
MALRSQMNAGAFAPSRTEVIALILSVVWMLGVSIFFLVTPAPSTDQGFDSLRFVLILMALFLPVAMIWVAAVAARSAKVMREEAQLLHEAIDTLRDNVMTERQGSPLTSQSSVERKLNQIAQATKKPDAPLATFTSSRDAGVKLDIKTVKPVPPEQRALALDVQPEDDTPPLPRVDLIRALNFPDTEGDAIGFAALRKALKDRSARQLVQASQDVLTLLSQDGIYMDDLAPDRSRPELWRRFAQGERGRAIGALGGVRDRTSLALTTARMREDPIFRDACHHFLRHFDKMLVSFEVVASDAELIELADTRTARAFMLLGRVTGAFD